MIFLRKLSIKTIFQAAFSLVFLLTNNAFNCLANDNGIVLIIDTFVKSGMDVDYSLVISDTDVNAYQNEINVDYIYKSYNAPKIVVTNITTNQIAILIDNKGGYFFFTNLHSLNKDTLRINKWELVKNNLPDTTTGAIQYFHKINDSLSKAPYKTKDIYRISNKRRKVCLLKNIEVVINGQKKQVQLTTTTSSYISSFHSYKPHRVYNKYLNNNDTNKVYKYKLLSGYTETVQNIYTGEVDLEQL